MKQFPITKLYFKHVFKTDLQIRGVTADDLAEQLERHGFIKLVGQGKYVDLQSEMSPAEKVKYFRAIWNTQPKGKV